MLYVIKQLFNLQALLGQARSDMGTSVVRVSDVLDLGRGHCLVPLTSHLLLPDHAQQALKTKDQLPTLESS